MIYLLLLLQFSFARLINSDNITLLCKGINYFWTPFRLSFLLHNAPHYTCAVDILLSIILNFDVKLSAAGCTCFTSVSSPFFATNFCLEYTKWQIFYDVHVLHMGH